MSMATNGYDHRGREIGVADMRGTMSRMNAAEEVVSRAQETQLQSARAARHLMADTSAGDVQGLIAPDAPGDTAGLHRTQGLVALSL